jgi:phosphoglycerol transferase MdoB-like AlkP superfamily enzyme
MAAHPQAPERETTASPLDRHASPVSDRPAGAGKTRHGRATAALIISILGIVFAVFFALLGIILSIVGTVLAATARMDIKRRGMVGGGQAKAALICGIVGIVLNVASMIAGAIIVSS